MGIAAPERTGPPVTAGGVVPLPLFVGFTVAATGGPLALVALNVPGTVASRSSTGLVVLLAVLAFAAPAAIWYRYSEAIVSSGGLYSFVEAAAGRRAALTQGAIWTVSYGLYLPYTITYIVYDLLPVVFPGVGPHRALLEVTLPLVVVGVAVLPVRGALLVAGALAAAQVALVAALLVAARAGIGAPARAFAAHGSTGTLLHGSVNVSLLFVCSSLPLFLGGEVRGGSRTVRRGLVVGLGGAAAVVLLGSLVWNRTGAAVLGSPIPGVALARASWGHAFGTWVGLGVVASTAGVILAEYVALSRLLHTMAARPISWANGVVAVGFVGASLLSLIDPESFYADLVKPSLVALWVSQLAVVAVYPRWAARRAGAGGWRAPLVVSAGACGLFGYGLYSALTLVSGT